MPTPRRRKEGFFTVDAGSPPALEVRVQQRIHFSDVDAMAILWHGRYAQLFEVANEAIGRLCGMTYADFFAHKLKAPIVQLHVDYFSSVRLSEVVTIVGRMIWNDGARLNIEYQVLRENGQLAAAGYTVQMFMDEHDQPLMASPALYDAARSRWLAGHLSSQAGDVS